MLNEDDTDLSALCLQLNQAAKLNRDDETTEKRFLCSQLRF